MKTTRFLTFLGTTSALLMGLSLIAMTSQPAKADWWDVGKQIIEDNLNGIRGNTVGRIYDQTFIAELSSEEVGQYKQRWGGDYSAKISDWCNDTVYQAGWRNLAGNQIPFVNTTWREENGKVNCYVRHAAQ
jgi:hypothetical protein